MLRVRLIQRTLVVNYVSIAVGLADPPVRNRMLFPGGNELTACEAGLLVFVTPAERLDPVNVAFARFNLERANQVVYSLTFETRPLRRSRLVNVR